MQLESFNVNIENTRGSRCLSLLCVRMSKAFLSVGRHTSSCSLLEILFQDNVETRPVII